MLRSPNWRPCLFASPSLPVSSTESLPTLFSFEVLPHPDPQGRHQKPRPVVFLSVQDRVLSLLACHRQQGLSSCQIKQKAGLLTPRLHKTVTQVR